VAVILRRLLRIGGLPGAMRRQVEAEGIIHLAEYVSVVVRFTGRVPGRIQKGNVRPYVGSLVLTNRRVLGTVSIIPGVAGRSIDLPWTQAHTGVVKGTLSEEGLLLAIDDISQIDPSFSGTFSLKYKAALPQDVLARVPTRLLAFDVPPKWILSAIAVPVH
jgi:hypothetical protein